MKYVCQDCGDVTEGNRGWDEWNCVICGGNVVGGDTNEVVHKSELRELVEEWRENADSMMEDIDTTSPHYTGCSGAMCMGVKVCADELEALLDD